MKFYEYLKSFFSNIQYTDKFIEFENKINYKFKKKELLIYALTHSSKEKNSNSKSHFERMEFLGDAVLNMVVTEKLFKEFPDLREGDMSKKKSKLVSRKFLAVKAIELNLQDYIAFGRAIGDKTGKRTILGNTMEALIAAIYLDSGIIEAKKFIHRFILHDFKDFLEEDFLKNYKSIIQEYTQKKYHRVPVYKLVKMQDLGHDKIFTISISINGEIVAYGEGKNKKSAEQDAAKNALLKLGLTQK